MAKKGNKKAEEEKVIDAEEEASAKFFEQEKAEYDNRMKLAAEINAANSDEVAKEKNASDDSELDDSKNLSDENLTEGNDDQNVSSGENKEEK